MPNKTATCSKEKVIVTVYVERPRRKASSNHHRHTIQQEVKHGGSAEGYNRRAELLRYSRSLREIARSAESEPLLVKPVVPSSDQQTSNNKTVGVQRKPKYSKTPGCFDNWGILIPCFLRSSMEIGKIEKRPVGTTSALGNTKKMKTAMRSLQLQMQNKWKYFSKPIFMLNKRR